MRLTCDMFRVTIPRLKKSELLHGRVLAFRANVSQSTFDRGALDLFNGPAFFEHAGDLGFDGLPIELRSQRSRTVDKHGVLDFRRFGFDKLMKLVIEVIGWAFRHVNSGGVQRGVKWVEREVR